MDKILTIFGVLSLALLAILGGAIVLTAPASENAPISAVPPAPGNSVTPNDPATGGAQDDVLALARLTVMSDPTYMFDGMGDTLKFNIDNSADPAIATAEFTSSHAGYGNRSDMMVAEVLTPHKCIITISQGKVQSAVMDDVWDMMAQKEISS